jgi:hypothetical protein
MAVPKHRFWRFTERSMGPGSDFPAGTVISDEWIKFSHFMVIIGEGSKPFRLTVFDPLLCGWTVLKGYETLESARKAMQVGQIVMANGGDITTYDGSIH